MGFFRKQRELYEFKVGNAYYRYTDSAKEIEFNSSNYIPEPIGRDSIKVTNEIEKNNLKINVKDDNPVAKFFIVGVPEERVSMKLYQQDRDDSDVFSLVFSGDVVTKEFKRGHKTVLVVQSLSQTSEVNGLTRRYCKTCTHVLYDVDTCRASEIKESSPVIAIDGRDITLNSISQSDGYYNGGGVTINGNKRTIGSQVGDVITLVSSIEAGVGDLATLVAGCDHSVNTCNSKFNNLLNHGGQPFIPEVNPFEGSLI